MQTKSIANEKEMAIFAEEFAKTLNGGEVIFLKGDLGVGKTTFTRYLLKALGHEARVKSPTFTIMEPYELEHFNVYHYDLYRLADPSELEYLGISDQLDGKHVLIVEWPERAGGLLDATVTLDIQQLGEDEREVLIFADR